MRNTVNTITFEFDTAPGFFIFPLRPFLIVV